MACTTSFGLRHAVQWSKHAFIVKVIGRKCFAPERLYIRLKFACTSAAGTLLGH